MPLPKLVVLRPRIRLQTAEKKTRRKAKKSRKKLKLTTRYQKRRPCGSKISC